MSQPPINVTYSLEDILKEINQKLEKLNDKIDDIKKDMTDVPFIDVRMIFQVLQ